MSERSFITILHHTDYLDAAWSAEVAKVVVSFDYAATAQLTLADAEHLHNALGNALAHARRTSEFESTESGMTELDCALLQANSPSQAVTR
ncbi:hypothetical protein ACIP5Y_21290 [Nocardia sp. NPDC088792]|uniref:hypothetical protein n=1 Tax=Nocardia sp. NPDC088792 TaxID=3364332 RepID=UPI00382AEDE2